MEHTKQVHRSILEMELTQGWYPEITTGSEARKLLATLKRPESSSNTAEVTTLPEMGNKTQEEIRQIAKRYMVIRTIEKLCEDEPEQVAALTRVV